MWYTLINKYVSDEINEVINKQATNKHSDITIVQLTVQESHSLWVKLFFKPGCSGLFVKSEDPSNFAGPNSSTTLALKLAIK